MLYLIPSISETCYNEKKHINATRGFCHGNILEGDKVAFIALVSVTLKDFILNNLGLGLSISQMMAKHQQNV